MNVRLAGWIAAAGCHLALVVLGAMSLSFPGKGPRRVLNWYGAASGADSGYGFFSPGVGLPVRVGIVLFDASGQSWTDVLYEGNNEVNLRLTGAYVEVDKRELRERLFASWAAKMFARHSTAQRVLIQIDGYELPTMTEYAAGERPSWRREYEAEFKRSDPKQEE